MPKYLKGVFEGASRSNEQVETVHNAVTGLPTSLDSAARYFDARGSVVGHLELMS